MCEIFVVLGRLLKYILIQRSDNILTVFLYAYTYQATCLQPHTQSKTDRKKSINFSSLQNTQREREREGGGGEGGREEGMEKGVDRKEYFLSPIGRRALNFASFGCHL